MNSELKNKVVYGWYDSGEIFYVGIGTIQRSNSRTGRNPHCKSRRKISEDNGNFEIRIFQTGLTLEEAGQIEKQLIKEYGRRDQSTGCLTNMTDGGEGVVGYWKGRTLSKNHKNNISEGRTGVLNKWTLTEETKQRMSKNSATRGKFGKDHPKSRPVSTPIGEFESLSAAAEAYEVSYSTMHRWCSSSSSGRDDFWQIA